MTEVGIVAHDHFMRLALNKASEALEDREVPIGCVIVWKNDVIASGRNDVNRSKNPTRHAELVAIDQIHCFCVKEALKEKEVLKDCILYVTAEPCVMCAAVLRLVGLTKIYYGCTNQRFGGCGSRLDVHIKEMGLKSSNCSSPDSKKARLELNSAEGCNTWYGEPLVCIGGVLSEEAIQLLKIFYAGENPNAPQPKDKTGRKKVICSNQKKD